MIARATLLGVTVPMVIAAQQPPSLAAPPQIIASASAEVMVRPDRASLIFAVESRATTAAKAGAETARRQSAVLDTVRSLGVATEQITTAAVEIAPEMTIPSRDKPATVAGYVARNAIRIEVLKIDQTGLLIDAALAKGASGIGSLTFTSSATDDARRRAIEIAVLKARREAETAAGAAGGSLGSLIELSVQPANESPIPLQVQRMQLTDRDVGVPTPVSPGELKVGATIASRWNFNGTRHN